MECEDECYVSPEGKEMSCESIFWEDALKGKIIIIRKRHGFSFPTPLAEKKRGCERDDVQKTLQIVVLPEAPIRKLLFFRYVQRCIHNIEKS